MKQIVQRNRCDRFFSAEVYACGFPEVRAGRKGIGNPFQKGHARTMRDGAERSR